MRQKSDKTQQPGNKGVEALYLENIALAQKAEQSGNMVLSQTFYQNAEFCLHTMKEGSKTAPVATIHPSTNAPHSKEDRAFEKLIQKHRFGKASRIGPSDGLYGAQNECAILPFKSE
jgi:hypothetical protein